VFQPVVVVASVLPVRDVARVGRDCSELAAAPALPHLHLSGNVAQAISRIPGEFRQAQKMVAVAVEGFAGCKLE